MYSPKEEYYQKYLKYKTKYLNQSAGLLNKTPVLESATQKFVDSIKDATPLYELSPEAARKVLDDIQHDESYKSMVDIESFNIRDGNIAITIFRPKGEKSGLNAVIYFHGGGWVLGNNQTHGRLVSQIAVGANVAVVFVDYTPAPDAKYPIQLTQCIKALEYIGENGMRHNINTDKLIIAGDSVGGNMTAAISQWLVVNLPSLSAKIAYQIILYPVADARMNSESYQKYQNGPWLTKMAMEWFFNAYEPDAKARLDSSISIINADPSVLAKLPATLLITDENDVLREEGEAYGRALMQAGIDVTIIRFIGTIHDFMMLDPLKDTPAAVSATRTVIDHIRKIYEKN